MLGLSIPSTGIILFTAGLEVEPAQPAHPLMYYLPLGFLLVRTCRTAERFLAGLKGMLPFFRFLLRILRGIGL